VLEFRAYGDRCRLRGKARHVSEAGPTALPFRDGTASVTDADAVGERVVVDAKSEGRVGLDLRVGFDQVPATVL
jgi:hypothetical protein